MSDVRGREWVEGEIERGGGRESEEREISDREREVDVGM